jgi:hypothetical protein
VGIYVGRVYVCIVWKERMNGLDDARSGLVGRSMVRGDESLRSIVM